MAYRVLTDYPRRAHLEFFRRNANPFYGVTFELDASAIRAAARAAGASTYAAMVWAYHGALLRIDAFRTRLVGEDVVLHDSLSVGMTVRAPDRRFTFAKLEWQEHARAFLAHAAEVIAHAEQGVDLGSGDAPDFAYYTALPKVPFTHFSHVALADATAGQPETAFGKFRETDGRTLVPVGVTVNHLYVDGADLGDLYEGAQDAFTRAF